MSDYRQYKRSSIAEMAPWTPGFDMTGVSISVVDLNDSPQEGDMIARNPENHNDRWLVAAAYFAANFETFGITTEDTIELTDDEQATQEAIPE